MTPTVFIGQQQQARALVPSDDSLGGDWTTQEFDDSGWDAAQMGIGYDENSTYVPEFGSNGNLGDAFNNVNTSVYIRVPFEVSDPSTITNLTLKMKYDDGFVAYLNDNLIADANAPGGLTWESEATGNHSDGEARPWSSRTGTSPPLSTNSLPAQISSPFTGSMTTSPVPTC